VLALGIAAAVGASVLYNPSIALQALEARGVPPDHSQRPSLLGRLLRNRRWLGASGRLSTPAPARSPCRWSWSRSPPRRRTPCATALGALEIADYRPPYGIFSAVTLRAVRQRGWRPVLWSKWGRDWTRRATATSTTRRACSEIAAGDIVLLHDADYYSAPGSWARTAAALPLILAELDGGGLKTISLRR
jgi:hypothetical protein